MGELVVNGYVQTGIAYHESQLNRQTDRMNFTPILTHADLRTRRETHHTVYLPWAVANVVNIRWYGSGYVGLQVTINRDARFSQAVISETTLLESPGASESDLSEFQFDDQHEEVEWATLVPSTLGP